MLGAIIGDIVGSAYEFHNIKTKKFTFFTTNKNYTDDSVLTIATADWLLHGGNVAELYSRYGNNYPMAGYGGMFRQWLRRSALTGDFSAYNSFGNGSAMRISPVGWAFSTKEETLAAAKQSAECTHNHPEGIKGAQATALCIFMARNGASAEEIRTAIENEFGYNLSITVDELRPRYSWDGLDGLDGGGSCQGSVPEAIICALEATDFEDAVRNAISIGGDSDTIGCIAGGIAEAMFGIPQDIVEQGMEYLPAEFKKIVIDFENKYGPRKHETLASVISRQDRPAYTPGRIDSLKEDEVFVFGSNLNGYHGGGAARIAMDKFGAVWGKGVGLQGSSYAIPTMQGGVETIRPYVDEFIRFAREHQELFFYVTRIGCGIAGFTDEEIAPLFKDAVNEENICLPRSFVKIINS